MNGTLAFRACVLRIEFEPAVAIGRQLFVRVGQRIRDALRPQSTPGANWQQALREVASAAVLMRLRGARRVPLVTAISNVIKPAHHETARSLWWPRVDRSYWITRLQRTADHRLTMMSQQRNRDGENTGARAVKPVFERPPPADMRVRRRVYAVTPVEEPEVAAAEEGDAPGGSSQG